MRVVSRGLREKARRELPALDTERPSARSYGLEAEEGSYDLLGFLGKGFQRDISLGGDRFSDVSGVSWFTAFAAMRNGGKIRRVGF